MVKKIDILLLLNILSEFPWILIVQSLGLNLCLFGHKFTVVTSNSFEQQLRSYKDLKISVLLQENEGL